MALDTKDKVGLGVIVAILAGAGIHYYGTRFDHTTGTRNASIDGETVQIESYENRLWGGGKYIRVDGTGYDPDTYLSNRKNKLEKSFEEALVEKKE